MADHRQRFEQSRRIRLLERARKWLCRACTALLLSMALFPLPGDAFEFSGKVVRVVDGDTLWVLNDGKTTKVRLANIDCPEKAQPFGQRAKTFASSQVFGREVTILSSTGISPVVDRYGRIIGSVFLPDGSCLNESLLRAGYAWQYAKYSNDPELKELEQQARLNRQGLWIDNRSIPPWLFRSGRHRAHNTGF